MSAKGRDRESALQGEPAAEEQGKQEFDRG